MKCFKLTLAIALAAIFVSAVTAEALERRSTTGGRWQDTGTWVGGTVPVDGDDVIIEEGHIVTVEYGTAEVNTIVIRDSTAEDDTPGELHLKSGATLAVRVSIDVEDTQAVPGVFDSIDTTTTTPIVQASRISSAVTDTLDGPYFCGAALGINYTGENSDDAFQLLSGGTMTSTGGKTTMSADFENDGLITANGTANNYDIEFDGSCALATGCAGKFEVTTANAEMIFTLSGNVAISAADCDFNISAGRMQFSRVVSTTGGYQQTGGTCLVDAGDSFTATGAY